MDGTLYYVHQDHVGSTVAVSDAAGQSVGRVQYDPYGEVITSTLPITLTDRLFTALDSRLGLVYHGDGRYYDAYLGRHIQPAAFAGPLEMPQTLNRYAASGGVGSLPGPGRRTGYGGGFPWAALLESTASNSISAAIDELALGRFGGWLVSKAPWHWLNIEVVLRHPRYHIRKPLKNLVGSPVANQLAKGELDEWSGVVRVGGDEYVEWAGRLGRRGVSVEVRSIASAMWESGPGFFKAKYFVPGLGADLLVGGVWQLGEDLLTHPELLNNPELLGRRFFAGTLYNATTGLMGTTAAAVVAGFTLALGFPVTAPTFAVMALVATIGIEVFWGEQIEEWWFERLNARASWE